MNTGIKCFLTIKLVDVPDMIAELLARNIKFDATQDGDRVIFTFQLSAR